MKYEDQVVYERRAGIIIEFLREYKIGQPLVGVEIGVWQGDLICFLLDLDPRIKKMYGIDPFTCGTGYLGGKRQRHWDVIFQGVSNKMSVYGDRVSLIRGMSEESPNCIPMVDFVEIDGVHRYFNVLQDIENYEKKINKGGMLCGHDYFGRYGHSIRRAIHAYTERHGEREVHSDELSGMWWWRII